jgi:lipopolysaccharide export system permease protein
VCGIAGSAGQLLLTLWRSFPYEAGRQSWRTPRPAHIPCIPMKLLHWYVLRQLLWVFAVAVMSLTGLLVVVGVIGEAAKSGLGPEQIKDILPYIVPSLLPFTIPATFLLTVCVVYGRLAADNEITAIKAAGINVMSVLWPALSLAGILSLVTFYLTDQAIPWARANVERVVLLAMEDIFLGVLQEKNYFSDTDRGIAVSVRRVQGRRLIEPHFRYTLPGGRSVNITAKEATLRFELAKKQVMIHLVEGQIVTPDGNVVHVADEQHPFPLPMQASAPRPRNMTISEIRKAMLKASAERLAIDQKRELNTVLALTRGDYARLFVDDQSRWQRSLDEADERFNKHNTEIHARLAMGCSCFFFTLLGGPFAVWQGRRQFLTNFAICFGPILVVYYPILLVSMNLGKDAKVNPAYGMWFANAGLLVAAFFVLRRVLRH